MERDTPEGRVVITVEHNNKRTVQDNLNNKKGGKNEFKQKNRL